MRRVIGILICVIAVLLVIVFGGCKYREVLERKKVEGLVADFMEAYIKGDANTCNRLLCFSDKEDMGEFSEFQKLLAQNILYNIQEYKKYKDCYIVSLNIENVNLGDIMCEVEKNYSDESESVIYNVIIEKIKICTTRKNFTCKATVLKVDEQMQILMTDSLSNALFGGFNEYIGSSLGQNGEYQK